MSTRPTNLGHSNITSPNIGDRSTNCNHENCKKIKDERENKTRVSHEYKVGDEILLKNAWKTKFNQDAYLGPYCHTQLYAHRACHNYDGIAYVIIISIL